MKNGFSVKWQSSKNCGRGASLTLVLYQSFSEPTRTLYGRCSVLLRSGAIMDARKRLFPCGSLPRVEWPLRAVVCEPVAHSNPGAGFVGIQGRLRSPLRGADARRFGTGPRT